MWPLMDVDAALVFCFFVYSKGEGSLYTPKACCPHQLSIYLVYPKFGAKYVAQIHQSFLAKNR